MKMEEISYRGSTPWWRVVVWVVTVVVLAASCLTAVSTSAQAANLEQHNPVTYNMQGSSAATTPKWSSDTPGLLNHHVIALHHAGPVPPLDPRVMFPHQRPPTSATGPRVYHCL